VGGGHFVLWGFMSLCLALSELDSTLKLVLTLELKLPFLMPQTTVHLLVL